MRRILILDLILAGLLVGAAVRLRNDWRAFEAGHQPASIQPESEPLRKLPTVAASVAANIDWTEIPTRHPFSYDRTDTPMLQPVAPPKPPGPKPMLFGTMSLGRERVAMVGPGQAGNRSSRPMKVGETIDGWTITQILDKAMVVAANSIQENVIMNDPTVQAPRDTARTAPAPPPSVVSVGSAPAPAPVPVIASPTPSANGQPRQRRRIMQQTPFGVREIEIEE